MSSYLGVSMPIINMGGASGSIGMQDVFNAPRNGYRILGTSMASLATVRVMGLAPISHTDWFAWNAAFTPNLIVVRRDSPHRNLNDLIAYMRANPGRVTIGTAGTGSSGHVGGVVFAEGAGVTFSHIPYEGGGPAIIATLGGEVDVNTQLLSELIDHVRSGDLRALASTSDRDITITGIDGRPIVIPSILNYLPNMAGVVPLGGDFGIMVPRDTPMNIVQTLDRAYAAAVASSAFARFAEDRGKIVVGMNRDQTDAYLNNVASNVTYVLYDAGLTVVSPASLGIRRR